MNKLRIYIALFILLIGILFLLEANKPKPIDWSPSFNKEHKRPWGAYILYEELPNIFPEMTIESVERTPYEKLEGLFYDDQKSTYIFINDILEIDKKSLEQLLNFVYNGNTAFLASNSLPKFLKDTLKFKAKNEFYYNYNDTIKKELFFANNKLNTGKKDQFFYTKGFESYYFNELDKETTTVLGYHILNEKEYINYVKIDYGLGEFLINLQPFAFTNFNMLKEDHANYVTSAFSYIKSDELLWDNHNKAGLEYIDNDLRYILSRPALKWAWRLSLAGILIFIFFRAKRRQRIIPIINKLPNTSVAFAKTIGNLYYQEGEPKDIISKKIMFFLEYIRNTYLLDTQNLNNEFKKRLHHKTGIPKEEINRLIDYIISSIKNEEPKENSLVTLNKLIDKFHLKTKL